jgi:hypothetical protein
MANEIGILHDQIGETLYAVVHNGSGQCYAGVTPEARTVANWATYKIALTETPASSYFYVGTFPAVASGFYFLDIYIQGGGAAAIGDFRVGTILAHWDGTTLRPQGVDVRQVLADGQTASDLKDFADAGYDPSTHKVETVKIADSAALASVCTAVRLARLDPITDTLTSTPADPLHDTALEMDHGARFQGTNVVAIYRVGVGYLAERILITAAGSDSITVVRGWGGTTPVALAADDVLVVLASPEVPTSTRATPSDVADAHATTDGKVDDTKASADDAKASADAAKASADEAKASAGAAKTSADAAARPGEEMDLVDEPNAEAIGAIQDGLATPADTQTAKLAADGLDAVPTTAPAGVAATFREMVVAVWRRFFARTTLTQTQLKTYADDEAAVITTQAVSDNGRTQTIGRSQ